MSSGLKCQFVEYRPGVWYCVLEDDFTESGDWRANATAHGPHPTLRAAQWHLEEHYQNPGAFEPLLHVSPSNSDPLIEDCILQNRQFNFDLKALVVEYRRGEWYVILESSRHLDEPLPWDWRSDGKAHGPFDSETAARGDLFQIEPDAFVWGVLSAADVATTVDPLLDQLIAEVVP